LLQLKMAKDLVRRELQFYRQHCWKNEATSSTSPAASWAQIKKMFSSQNQS